MNDFRCECMDHMIIIYKAVIINVSNHSTLQSVGEGRRFPTRHGGNLRTPRHRLALSESQFPYTGITFSINVWAEFLEAAY